MKPEELPYSMQYPHFVIAQGRVIPHVPLPLNFRELVPKFYADGGRERIERFRDELVERMQDPLDPLNCKREVRLAWEEERGLTSISLSSSGLDLQDERGLPCFQEHNMGRNNSFLVGAIAIEYVLELVKSGE